MKFLPLTNQISIRCLLLDTGVQLLFAYLENYVEIRLVILLLSRQKFHDKQIFVLSSFMKRGLGGCWQLDVLISVLWSSSGESWTLLQEMLRTNFFKLTKWFVFKYLHLCPCNNTTESSLQSSCPLNPRWYALTVIPPMHRWCPSKQLCCSHHSTKDFSTMREQKRRHRSICYHEFINFVCEKFNCKKSLLQLLQEGLQFWVIVQNRTL